MKKKLELLLSFSWKFFWRGLSNPKKVQFYFEKSVWKKTCCCSFQSCFSTTPNGAIEIDLSSALLKNAPKKWKQVKAYHTLESQLGIFLFFSCSLCIHIVTKDPGPSLRKMSISFQLLLFLLGKAMMSITMSLHLAGAAAFFILMFFTSPIQAAGGDCMGGKLQFSSFFFLMKWITGKVAIWAATFAAKINTLLPLLWAEVEIAKAWKLQSSRRKLNLQMQFKSFCCSYLCCAKQQFCFIQPNHEKPWKKFDI